MQHCMARNTSSDSLRGPIWASRETLLLFLTVSYRPRPPGVQLDCLLCSRSSRRPDPPFPAEFCKSLTPVLRTLTNDNLGRALQIRRRCPVQGLRRSPGGHPPGTSPPDLGGERCGGRHRQRIGRAWDACGCVVTFRDDTPVQRTAGTGVHGQGPNRGKSQPLPSHFRWNIHHCSIFHRCKAH